MLEHVWCDMKMSCRPRNKISIPLYLYLRFVRVRLHIRERKMSPCRDNWQYVGLWKCNNTRICYVGTVHPPHLVQALRLCTGRTTHRGSTGIALPFHDHGTRRGWGVSVTPRPIFTPGEDPVPIVQEAVWAPGAVWTGVEYLASHRDSIPGPSIP